jgi:hypothetical protein
MRSDTQSLAPLKIAIGGGSDPHTLSKALSPSKEAHRATGLTPLKPSLTKNGINPFRFRGSLDATAARHAKRFHAFCHTVSRLRQIVGSIA